MKYYMNYNCHYVTGKLNAAIYDLQNKKLYHLNKDARTVMDVILNGTQSSLPVQEMEHFIKQLFELNLLSESPLSSERIIDSDEKHNLRYAWLELTEKCNMDCIHCYGEFGHPVSKPEIPPLTLAEWKEILSYLKSCGLKMVQFIGGEPLLYPYINELLEWACDLGFQTDIFSNGYFINQELVDTLKKTNTRIRLSLYGYDEKTHDSITHFKGSFKHLDHAIDCLKKSGVTMSIAVVIMKENEAYFEEIKKYVEEKGEYFSYDVIRPVVCGSQSKHCISSLDIMKSRYFVKPEFLIDTTTFFQNKNWNPCWYGKLAISSSGDIFPCTFARNLSCGNLKNDSIKSISDKLHEFWNLSKNKIDGCNLCEYRYACHDCRPLALGIHNNLLSKYPRCCYNPETGIWENLSSVMTSNNEMFISE